MLHVCLLLVQPRPGEGGRAPEGSGLARSASTHSEIEPAERLLKSEEGLAPLTPKTRQARHTTPREVRRLPPVCERFAWLPDSACLCEQLQAVFAAAQRLLLLGACASGTDMRNEADEAHSSCHPSGVYSLMPHLSLEARQRR